MLNLLTLSEVSALKWGTLTRQASSYTTPLSPTMPVLTLYHRVREHMVATDLNHETNFMTSLQICGIGLGLGSGVGGGDPEG